MKKGCITNMQTTYLMSFVGTIDARKQGELIGSTVSAKC